ncbi:MAG: cation-transporting P-type ATPase [Hamadaea sp.]|nr:cation-transporting P-type ATPase [Hamadaea sp.]
MGDRKGLSSAEAAERLAETGANSLPTARRPSAPLLLIKQVVHFFALLLWAAVGLAWLAGLPQLSVAIALVIVVNGIFAFIQEYRADRAADRLRDLLPVSVAVRRDGRRQPVPAIDLVPGDIVLLEAGDQVSADMRTYAGHGLSVDESTLTGESVPRRVNPADAESALMYAGTFIVEGAGEAEVVATGSQTRLAGIAALTRRTRRPPSPLALRLNTVVRVIAAVAVVAGIVFFALAVLLGMAPMDGFLLALGVTVALVPEGLLPTVTLSLAWGARRMAERKALVKRLESVETLGSVTFICTDKTGTLTRNEMSAVEVWTPIGVARVAGVGYEPVGDISADIPVMAAVRRLAYAAARASTGHLRRIDGRLVPAGDPTEVALYVLAARAGIDLSTQKLNEPTIQRYPFDHRRLLASAVAGTELYVKGAPEAVLARCSAGQPLEQAGLAAAEMNRRGLRTLAVAARALSGPVNAPETAEAKLTLLGVVGLLDPPRSDVAEAIAECRTAGIRIAMITGDHPGTARAVADHVGLLGSDGLVLTGADLPADERALAELLDRDGVVVARVRPEDKLRITQALQGRGHVVAMTGDGVNDAPALRVADIGVAMGATGTDVAREAADLVLLDDHFGTIVAAVELGRATFANLRRFLTYHLTDNVAELAPFVLWALTGGMFPLAIGVLQVLALDIGTDLLPALALGAEPPGRRALRRGASQGRLLDRKVLIRSFGVLGPTEVLTSMAAFAVVLLAGGWRWGQTPPTELQTVASGTAFAAIVLGQLANALACRSESRPPWRLDRGHNPLLLGAIGVELVLLVGFLGVPWVAELLGGSWPSALGWAMASLAIPAVLAADAIAKTVRARRTRRE